MATQADLIDFDIIETHKENIQSLPGGRSARALVNLLSPLPSGKSVSPCDTNTKTLNDAIRQEYEIELQSISESDDPLDIFDRYVKWTMNAYPSAQATPQSQLLPLLERSTKAFLSSPLYKNDPRYLKLWLQYIRFFSDSPRETFAFLARHNIGQELALFYEEFAAWLETAGRWNQAEEVYKMGLEREARPTERLLRKFGQFQQRYEQRPQNNDEPSSPALPTVRPALAAKVDPFAASTPRNDDPQVSQSGSGVGASTTARSGKPKMAIFSDADGASPQPALGAETKGWDTIGSLQDRKKENAIEAKPWAGETLKAGKRVGHVQKMEIFKDQLSKVRDTIPFESSHPDQAVINPKTGKAERVFVNLEAVYPNFHDPKLEMSFEELRAARRGWTSGPWRRPSPKPLHPTTGNEKRAESLSSPTSQASPLVDTLAHDVKTKASLDERSIQSQESFEQYSTQEERPPKTKRFKVREVKQETQTSKLYASREHVPVNVTNSTDLITVKINLASPTGPKIRRKNSSEPTMTFVSKAATDEIYDIFNQSLNLQTEAKDDTVSVAGESDDEEDDYTSAGESTGTGRISGTTSDFGDETSNSLKMSANETDENETQAGSGAGASEWTEFSASRHVPQMKDSNDEDFTEDVTSATQSEQSRSMKEEKDTESNKEEAEELVTPILPEVREVISHTTRYIPLPPEDYEAPTRPFRDPVLVAQNRLPFMTPIVEKTESSLAPSTAFTQEKDYFNSKTPSRSKHIGSSPLKINDGIDNLVLSSPFRDILTPEKNKTKATAHERGHAEESPSKKLKLVIARSPQAKAAKGPVIKDLQVIPCDDNVRSTITKSLYPPLSSFSGFHDHNTDCHRSNEIKKYIKSISISDRKSRGNSERTQTHMMPPVLDLQGSNRVYSVKRELGKGAFAPVYLVDCHRRSPQPTPSELDNEDDYDTNVEELAALKMEDPPTSWEFLVIRTLHSRLGSSSRTVQSLIQAHECHLYRDECFLILDYSDQGTLLDLVNLFRAENIRTGKSADAGGVDEVLAMFFAVELFRVVEDCHRQGIMHGDLKADNCLVRLDSDTSLNTPYNPDGFDHWSSKGLTLIDFGRGIDTRKFRADVQFVADWETGPSDCAEMRELRPWTWQADYFGIAGVVHSLLFGRYIEAVVDKSATSTPSSVGLDGGPVGGAGIGAKKIWKLKEGFKRYWQGEIWTEVFALLMNPTVVLDEDCGNGGYEKMPVFKGMKRCRERMEKHLVEEGERKGLRGLIRRAEGMVREVQQSRGRR